MNIRKRFSEIAKAASSEATERLSAALKSGLELHPESSDSPERLIASVPTAWLLNLTTGGLFSASLSGADALPAVIKDAQRVGHATCADGLAAYSRNAGPDMTPKQRSDLALALWLYLGGTSSLATALPILAARPESALDVLVLVRHAPGSTGVELRPAAAFASIDRNPTHSPTSILAFANHVLKLDRQQRTGWFKPL